MRYEAGLVAWLAWSEKKGRGGEIRLFLWCSFPGGVVFLKVEDMAWLDWKLFPPHMYPASFFFRQELISNADKK